MLIECQHCGAPLDVRAGVETSRCRYCGMTSRTALTKTLAPQTPPQWRPPPTWRPPQHVPADSNIELKYQGGGGGWIGVIVLLGILAGIGVPIYLSMHRPGGPLAGISVETLDKVTFQETPAQMADKLGGAPSGDKSKYLRVDLKGSFDYMVIGWDEKDPSHPASVSFHASKRKSCTSELVAMRDKIAKDLGPRFDGKSWSWGPNYLSFGEDCAMIAIHSTVSEEKEWKETIEALWAVVRSDVFGRPGKPAKSELLHSLALGYKGEAIATALASTTIDDAPGIVRKKFPATILGQSSGLRAELPLTHPSIGTLTIEWENKKAGPLHSIDGRAYKSPMKGHMVLAVCLGKQTGANVEVRETDYMKKTSSTSLKLPGMSVNINEYGFNAYGDAWKAIPAESIKKLLAALDACGE